MKFFHVVVNKKHKRSRIHDLNLNESWVSNSVCIKGSVFKFFSANLEKIFRKGQDFIVLNLQRLSKSDVL